MNWSSIFSFIGTDAPTQGLIWTIFALGVFVSYKILNVADLSVDSLFPFAGIISLMLINLGLDPVSALLISVVAGMGIGFINAALHVYLHIDPLLAGIIMMIALYTPNVILSKGNISLGSGKFTIFTGLNELIGNLTATKMVILAVLAAGLMVALYWFFGTELGLSLRASGKNAQMSKAQGINTDSRYILGMVISGAFIALAGALYGQMTKHLAADSGRGSIIIGLAILFLGEVVFGSKTFKISLISVVFGGVVYWLILDIIIELPGFNTNYLNLMKALFITLVVCANQLKKYVKKRKIIRNAALAGQKEGD